jgi:hypothetical protein
MPRVFHVNHKIINEFNEFKPCRDSHAETPSLARHSTYKAELVVFQQESHKGRVAVFRLVGRPATKLRQSDAGGSFQFQQKSAGDHIIFLNAAACVALSHRRQSFSLRWILPRTMFNVQPGTLGSAG